MSFTKPQQRQLLQIARDSIRYGLDYQQPLPVDLNRLADELKEKRASFVTLQMDGQLRGCIGMLEAVRPLAVDISENAFAAAFKDPRFPPVTEKEYERLELHLSILSPAREIRFTSEQDLIDQLQPGKDGLILQEGLQRGTFLPSVWESLPSPEQFLQHLKQKAGLPANYWSDSLRVYRYTTESIH